MWTVLVKIFPRIHRLGIPISPNNMMPTTGFRSVFIPYVKKALAELSKNEDNNVNSLRGINITNLIIHQDQDKIRIEKRN